MQFPDGKPKQFYQSLPKIELHRHLEGSLRLSTMLEVAHAYRLPLPLADPPRLKALVQIQKHEPLTSANFLSKFETLRLFFRTPEIIARITKEAFADAAADNLRYLELRFTPAALCNAKNFPLSEVMDWVIASAKEAETEYGIIARLIASVNRHESLEIAEKVVELAAERLDDGIVGLDLAGDETRFPAAPFASLFQEAKKAGLRLTVHAGEWGGPENIIEAIQVLGAERIGHGVRVLEDPNATALAREYGTTFEVCPTSNYQSGVVAALHHHPLPDMLAAGLNVTLNTDDPGISAIDLSDECRLACETLSLSLQDLRHTLLNAARAAFLPNGKRAQLENALASELPA